VDQITERLKSHYTRTFLEHGANSLGVDWGRDENDLAIRYQKMLEVIDDNQAGTRPTLLDVGCGFGGLLRFAQELNVPLAYTGIDVCPAMIAEAQQLFTTTGTFLVEDVFELDAAIRFDYVVCNGILTQKLETSNLDMDRFAESLIRQMFQLCSRGIAFNVMTTKVNFFDNKLYYRNPIELLAWCMSEISSVARLDHTYPLYEYTVFLYRAPVLPTKAIRS
jgi:SAM-dependent methyltransferase